MNPNKDGKWSCGITWRVDIQEEAVLAGQSIVGYSGGGIRILWTLRSESIGLNDGASIRSGSLGSLPSV